MCRISRPVILGWLLLGAAAPAWPQWTPMNPVSSVERQADGIVLALNQGVVKLQVCSDSIIRLRYAPTRAFPDNPDPVVIKSSWPAAKWTLEDAGNFITLTTERLKVAVDRRDASITYRTIEGRQISPGRLAQADSRIGQRRGDVTAPNPSSTSTAAARASTGSASSRRASGTTAATSWTCRTTTLTSRCPSSSRATATASSGTAPRAADSTTGSRTTSISAPKWPTSSTTTSSSVRTWTASSPGTAS